MKDFNEGVEKVKFNLGEQTKATIPKKLYETLYESIKHLIPVNDAMNDIAILDVYCSQSYIRDFLPQKSTVHYVGMDTIPSYERDGQKFAVEVKADINSIPIKNSFFDFIFMPGNKFGYARYHASMFEIERIIKPLGYLIVGLSKYWYLREFNQLLLCYRDWIYERVIEMDYILTDAKPDEKIETSKYFLIYQFQKK